MLVLGFQHTFAMFGATVLVPILTGINVSTALLVCGLGARCCSLLITKGKVPAFLSSSFAFLGGYAAVAPLGADGTPSEMLPYAAGGVVVAGTHLCGDERPYQGVRRKNALCTFSACSHRPHHHRHRPYSGAQRHHELPIQLAAGFHCAGHYCSVQHLGQGEW